MVENDIVWASGLEKEHHGRFTEIVNLATQWAANNPHVSTEEAIETAYLAALAAGDLTTTVDIT